MLTISRNNRAGKLVVGIVFMMVLTVMFSGCTEFVPLEEENIVDAENYFIHMTDTHIGALIDGYGFRDGGNAGALEKMVAEINSLRPQPMFVVITGDISHAGGGITGYNNLNWAKQILDNLDCDYYVTIGNHDYRYSFQTPRPYSDTNFMRVFGGPLDDVVVITNDNITVKLLLIDSGKDAYEDASILAPEGAGIFDYQLDFMEENLDNDTSNYTVIACHHPIVDFGDEGDACISNNRGQFKSICDRYDVDVVVTGHIHTNLKYNAFGVQWESGDGTMYVQTENSPAYTIVKLDGDLEIERRMTGEEAI